MTPRIFTLIFLFCWLTQTGAQTYHDSPSDFFFSKKVNAQPLMMSPGFISSGMNECGGTMSKKGDEFYYWLRKEGVFSVIVGTRFEDGFWTYPEVEDFSGRYLDASPCLSIDGRYLYFASNRPENEDDGIANWNIWRCTRRQDGKWLDPELMPFSKKDKNEVSVSVDGEGNVYFCADYEGETITLKKDFLDIFYVSMTENEEWGEVVKLGSGVNTGSVEQTPAVSPDGTCLVFSSSRAGGNGTADLYVSFYKDGRWSQSQNLGALVNTPAYEHCPVFTPDGELLLFTSTREVKMPTILNYSRLKKWVLGPGNGTGDIWYVKAASIRKEW